MNQDALFVFVTAQGRVMARLADGVVVDVTEMCDLLPQKVCKAHHEHEMRHHLKLAA